ncbi:hypothetical protein [Bacteroides sp.]|uniref:hypothetical protein n=1 Tax=Bacteroides sp. TaxID=29523 RepID=UPI00260C8C6B|nr:hypothetical protein [Bacteroides sp.]MDD3039076.1 hypothetical protein [Bacteroides sp.]
MQIKLSKKSIITAILHNNDAAYTGVNTITLGILPNSKTLIFPTKIVSTKGIRCIDPQELVQTPNDDTYMFRSEAHTDLVTEGCIRNVNSLERTEAEDAPVDERVNAYLRVWAEQIEFIEMIDDIQITWVK